jgi:DNA-binding Xre family transcriptional regulator
MREQGRKQQWLADQIGIGKYRMSLYIRGLVCPPEVQQRIAKALDCKVEDLWP